MPSWGVAVRGARRYLDEARALTRRAEALGAQLVGWGATTVAFAWDLDSVEEAVTLAVSLREDAVPAEGAWTCGIAEGPMEPLAPAGQRAGLAWGEPLVRLVALARIAEPGEVLVDASVTALARGELRGAGMRRGMDTGREVEGVRLDVQSPWGAVSETPPPSEQAPEPAPGSVPPGEEPERFAERMVELTRQALLSGNAQSLARLSEGLRATGEHDALADRMRAIARLSRGQIGDAVRALRQSQMLAADEPPTVRCQSSLALAFALATAGRPDEALVEGMDALARARDGDDKKAQAACLAFLAKLYARVGHAEGAARISSMLVSYPRTPSFSQFPSPMGKG